MPSAPISCAHVPPSHHQSKVSDSSLCAGSVVLRQLAVWNVMKGVLSQNISSAQPLVLVFLVA